MTTKEKVLLLLAQNPGKIHSGQMIADELHISRTAIWKAVKTLREEGYRIESAPNAGYTLSEPTDHLVRGIIQQQLTEKLEVTVLDTIDSTNEEAKRVMNRDFTHDHLVVADQQTEGKGRLGRKFYSPKQTGLYMSLALHEIPIDADPTLITTVAAVAVCQAIEKNTTLKPQIKWVNDLYLNGKKICGILTEGIINMETQTIQSIILGIGINIALNKEDVPAELAQVVGALFDGEATISRNQLAAAIINEFYALYHEMGTKQYLDAYRDRCFVLGERVAFTQNRVTYQGIATAIDDQGALVIQLDDGRKTRLSYGEISIQMEGVGGR